MSAPRKAKAKDFPAGLRILTPMIEVGEVSAVRHFQVHLEDRSLEQEREAREAPTFVVLAWVRRNGGRVLREFNPDGLVRLDGVSVEVAAARLGYRCEKKRKRRRGGVACGCWACLERPKVEAEVAEALRGAGL